MADTVFNPGPRCGVRWSEGAGRMCREGSSGSHVGRDPRAWLGDEEGLADGSRPEGSHSELTRVWKTRQSLIATFLMLLQESAHIITLT